MAVPQFSADGVDEPGIIGHFLASGELLPAQQPTPSNWSPEKKLAGAVLASALIDVRDHHHERHHKRKIAQDLEWIYSDDTEWPFSFVRLCQLFSLETEYVRDVVRRWLENSPAHEARHQSIHRNAA